MEFLSIPFVLCMASTFLLYYARTSRRWQHAILLAASVVFIGYYHLSYLAVALGITIFTFLMGKWLHAAIDTPRAGRLLGVGIVGLVGFWLAARYWSPVFPLGISFYTFQALGYLIDIYWEEEPEDDPLDFTLYMLLFVKFLSGPIERAYDLLPQLKVAQRFDYTLVSRGLKTVVWGCFLKLVIADRIGPALDLVLDHVQQASGMQLLLATLLYPIQLYADFAGYTLMALGLGRMLGFHLHPNFDRPFISQSTGELWRRWHMSLSFWVRDYVFTPLNASLRGHGQWGIYVSLLVTFVVIGVWHGAGWTFALYGLFQGLVIIYETAAKHFRQRVQNMVGQRIWSATMIVRTYLLFALSLLLFRLPHLADVGYTYTHFFTGFESSVKELRLGLSDQQWIVFALAVVIMFTVEAINSYRHLQTWLSQQHITFRWATYLVLLLMIFLYGAFGVENFIYIQF